MLPEIEVEKLKTCRQKNKQTNQIWLTFQRKLMETHHSFVINICHAAWYGSTFLFFAC